MLWMAGAKDINFRSWYKINILNNQSFALFVLINKRINKIDQKQRKKWCKKIFYRCKKEIGWKYIEKKQKHEHGFELA